MTSLAEKELGTSPPVLQQQESENGSPGTASDDVVPDGGYGYVCLACVFCINSFTWGVVAVSIEI